MAHPDMKKLSSLTVDEIRTQIRELHSELFQKKMQLSTGQLENTASKWKARKTMARLQTLLTQKTKAAAPVVAKAAQKA